MSYQPVRGAFQKLTYDALVAAGIAAENISFDNFGETSPGPDASYAVVNMSFTNGIQDVVGCEGIENLQGSLQVNVFTPKQQGSKPGEDICLEVVRAWNQLGSYASTAGLAQASVRGINGPFTVAPDASPHHVNNVSGRWMARAA